MDTIKRLLEIKKRKVELRGAVNTLTDDELDNALKEIEALEQEELELNKRIKELQEVEKRGRAVVTPVSTVHASNIQIVDTFENFIVALLARKARKAIDYAIINGDGETQATGLLTALADEITSTSSTSFDYDDIIDLKRSLKSGYYQNTTFPHNCKRFLEEEAKKLNKLQKKNSKRRCWSF